MDERRFGFCRSEHAWRTSRLGRGVLVGSTLMIAMSAASGAPRGETPLQLAQYPPQGYPAQAPAPAPAPPPGYAAPPPGYAAPPPLPPCEAVTTTPLRGAGRGAAVGAIGGAIGGNAGKGAAIGAAVGGVAGAARRGSARASGACY